MDEYFELNQDLPEYKLPAGSIGLNSHYRLGNNRWLWFPVKCRLKGFWIDRSMLYATECPENWMTEPVLFERME